MLVSQHRIFSLIKTFDAVLRVVYQTGGPVSETVESIPFHSFPFGHAIRLYGTRSTFCKEYGLQSTPRATLPSYFVTVCVQRTECHISWATRFFGDFLRLHYRGRHLHHVDKPTFSCRCGTQWRYRQTISKSYFGRQIHQRRRPGMHRLLWDKSEAHHDASSG